MNAEDCAPLPSTTRAYWPGAAPSHNDGKPKVLLLSMNWWREKDPRTPLGTAYLYSWLSRTGLSARIQVGLLDATVADATPLVVQEVVALDPAILGIGVYVWNNPAVRRALLSLRGGGYQGTIVLGGPEISYATEDLPSEFPGADYFVKGEGEVAMEEIVRAMLEHREPSGAGIFSAQSASFEGQSHLPRGVEPVQPQSLPELIPVIVKDGFGRIEFQRGCLFACSFCSFPFKDRVFTEFGVATLREDLRRLQRAGVRELAVLDPIFFHHKDRALMILRALAEELPGTRFEIQSRLEHLDDELTEQLARMNVRLECGVQTLDPKVQAAIHRGGRPALIERSLSRLRDLGVEFEAHLIFGLPFQTLESLLRDVAYLMDYQPRRLRLFPLLDHRGTTLSRETTTLYRGRLSFSDAFPRQVVETEWMPFDVVSSLKRLHLALEESPNPSAVISTFADAFPDTGPLRETARAIALARPAASAFLPRTAHPTPG